jgi:hypothetical protein
MMKALAAALLTSTVLLRPAIAGQVPGAAGDPDVPVSHRDRVYAAEQFSNTESRCNPARHSSSVSSAMARPIAPAVAQLSKILKISLKNSPGPYFARDCSSCRL